MVRKAGLEGRITTMIQPQRAISPRFKKPEAARLAQCRKSSEPTGMLPLRSDITAAFANACCQRGPARETPKLVALAAISRARPPAATAKIRGLCCPGAKSRFAGAAINRSEGTHGEPGPRGDLGGITTGAPGRNLASSDRRCILRGGH